MSRKELVTQNVSDMDTHPAIQQPGDKITQEMMPGGDVITRIATEEKNMTLRQYMKKDGTEGRKVLTIKQPKG